MALPYVAHPNRHSRNQTGSGFRATTQLPPQLGRLCETLGKSTGCFPMVSAPIRLLACAVLCLRL